MVAWKVLKWLVLGLVLSWIYNRVKFFKLGHFHHKQWPGRCQEVPGIDFGAEDAELVSRDLVLITSGLCLGGKAVCGEIKGQIFLFDFNNVTTTPVTIKWKPQVAEEKGKNFHPHGISIWHGTDRTTVMVVNHEPETAETVEIFSFHVETVSLVHLETITKLGDPAPAVLNDVKATGPRSFYFTNCIYFSRYEFLLGLPLGWLGHYDGTSDSAVIMDRWLGFPNGLEMSSDGRYLYVAQGSTETLDVYQRFENNSLELIKQVPLHALPDNLMVSPVDQSVWVGCISAPLKVSTQQGTSQILKLEVEAGVPTGKIRQVYYDNGGIVKSSSIGVYHNSKLLIGSITDKAALCQVEYVTA